MPRRTTLCAPNQMPALKVVLLATLTAALSVMLAALAVMAVVGAMNYPMGFVPLG